MHCPHSRRGPAARGAPTGDSGPDCVPEDAETANVAVGQQSAAEKEFDGDTRFLNMNRQVYRTRRTHVEVAIVVGESPTCLSTSTERDLWGAVHPDYTAVHLCGNLKVISIAQVTALAAGRLQESAERDTLLVGSQTNLLAYDVENNADIYYKVRRRDPARNANRMGPRT